MKSYALGLGLLGVLSPSLCFAQGTDEFGGYGRERQYSAQSPQNAAFEVRFGPYKPSVDDEFNGATPFEDTFGSSNRYLLGFELDWQALRIPKFGTFGPGIGWGYTKFTANAFLTGQGGERSEQKTTFEVMPMYLVGVLRVDVLARDTFIPLVPYAKLGLGYALWWSGDGDDGSTGADGQSGKDASYGWQYALGGMLLLDFLDPSAAADMDAGVGVNNSYFFMEWYVSHLDGFGGNQLNAGTNTWMLGLALEI